MTPDEIRFLHAYDRWATERVLASAAAVAPEVWSRPGQIDGRSVGAILVHQLGAAQRWRTAFETQGEGEGPRPEDEPLLSLKELQSRWEAEWAATEKWLAGLSEGFIAAVFDGVPVWQMLVHVINHGTQHRSEAALVLTREGCSPGELDLVDFAEERKPKP